MMFRYNACRAYENLLDGRYWSVCLRCWKNVRSSECFVRYTGGVAEAAPLVADVVRSEARWHICPVS